MSSQEEIDPRDTLGAWPLPRPRTLRPANAGTNNLSRFVDTPAGSYFLRIYQNTADLDHIRYEHALLLQLNRASLSFAVPLPLATHQGDTYAVLGNDGNGAVAALFPIIAGHHPQRGNVSHAVASGEALGELDHALARMDVDPALPAQPCYGDLGHIHPLVRDPLKMVECLPISPEQRTRLGAIFDELLACIADLYTRLPRQLIHRDFGRGNALLHRGRVRGVLDFEFASPDLRAMDLVAGLWSFGIAVWQTDQDWPVIEAFARGYRRSGTLLQREIDLLPVLLRLREATSLVHWAGRLRQGLTSEADLVERAEGMLQVDRWLQVHADELIRRVEHVLV